MRFGTWREAPLALGLAALLGLSLCATATTEAGGWPFHTTLPREVPAYDFNTGGEYFAPPVPYGHYAKDPMGHLANSIGLLKGCLLHGPGCAGHHGLGGHGAGRGDGCGDGCGHGLGHGLGNGNGLGCGHGLGNGLGDGCGFCSGKGLFSKLHGAGAGLGHGHGSGGAICDPSAGRVKNFGPYHPTGVVASGQAMPSAQAIASPQAMVMPSGQALCGGPGACGLKGCGHGGLLGKLRCKLCGGNGCGGCGGMGIGDPCSSCGGNGCGKCGGCGLLSRLGQCPFCHGAGCGNCLKGLGSKLHGLLSSPMGMLHRPKYQWFVGAGGPVPLTPGYVPYIVTTRSPRDFFAFPPKNPDAF